jgi:hypothetical protein
LQHCCGYNPPLADDFTAETVRQGGNHMHMLVTGGAGFVGSRLLLLVGFLMLAVVRKPVFWI